MNKPLLPKTEKLIPYLERIDENRWYTNYGELEEEYRYRISELFGAPCITGSSATSLLTATLMAYNLPKGSMVALPSYTFPATAAAVVSAGHIPFFCDVESDGIINTGGVNPNCKAMIVVAPFGKYPGEWGKFAELHGVPVIIDGAAAFDVYSTTHKPTDCPIIISTHATKSFGTGEGGLLFSHDALLLERVRRITNFGLTPDRRIEYTGLNCKFSEYHAAVGLTQLDEWPEKREKLLEAVKPYGIDYAITQVAVRGEGKMGVYGCHQHNAYKDFQRTDMEVTDDLIANVGCVYVGIE